MSHATVEERVSTLGRTVAELVRSQSRPGRVKDWRRTVGMFSGGEPRGRTGTFYFLRRWSRTGDLLATSMSSPLRS